MDHFFHNYGTTVAALLIGPAVICGIGAFVRDKELFTKLKGAFKKNESIKLEKKLCLKDEILLDLLSTGAHCNDAWVISDPEMADNPIIFASAAFCHVTGYSKSEVEGRNCRFLQGEKTDKEDVAKIHAATDAATETTVCIVNYRKDGTQFYNQLRISPLYTPNGKLAYYLGLQSRVESVGKGKDCKESAEKK